MLCRLFWNKLKNLERNFKPTVAMAQLSADDTSSYVGNMKVANLERASRTDKIPKSSVNLINVT
jgi:hypothetical protein